ENLTINNRGAKLVTFKLGAPAIQLRAKPAKTPLPALAISNNRSVDQQTLPSPRRAQSTFDHRHRIGDLSDVRDVGAGTCYGRGGLKLRRRRGAGEFEVRCNKAPRPVAIRVRHLRERK